MSTRSALRRRHPAEQPDAAGDDPLMHRTGGRWGLTEREHEVLRLMAHRRVLAVLTYLCAA